MLSRPLRLAAVTRTMSRQVPLGRGVDRISGLESSSNLSLHLLPDPPPSRLGESQLPCRRTRLGTCAARPGSQAKPTISTKPHLVVRPCSTLAPQELMIYYMHTASRPSVRPTSPQPKGDQSPNPTEVHLSQIRSVLRGQLRVAAAPYPTSLFRSAYRTISSVGSLKRTPRPSQRQSNNWQGGDNR